MIPPLAVDELLQNKGLHIAVEAPQALIDYFLNHNFIQELPAIRPVIVDGDGAIVGVRRPVRRAR